MASPFTVNINIDAGTDFTQQYTITNPDLSPVNITGYKFFANMAKNPTAIDAVVSTSGARKYAYHPFVTRVIDGERGIYSISMPPATTSQLEEGKYQAGIESSEVKLFAKDEIPWNDIAFTVIEKTIKLYYEDVEKGDIGIHFDTIIKK